MTQAAHSDNTFVEIHWTDRWIMPILVTGVVLDLIISVVLIFLALSSSSTASDARNAAHTALANQESTYAACLQTDETRSGNITLWNDNHQLWTVILGFFQTPPGAPPAEVAGTNRFKNTIQAQVDEQQALAQKVNAPRDCSQLNPKTASTHSGTPLLVSQQTVKSGKLLSGELVGSWCLLIGNTAMFLWIYAVQRRRIFYLASSVHSVY